MLAAIEQGESINVEAISDFRYRSFLHSIFKLLPLESMYGAYYKVRSSNSSSTTSSILLNTLLKSGAIVQPLQLSRHQTSASRIAPLHLLALLKEFPALITEMPSLLETLKAGQVVNISDISNDSIKAHLMQLFRSLEIEEIECGSFSRVKNDKKTEDAISHFSKIFAYHNACSHKHPSTLAKETKPVAVAMAPEIKKRAPENMAISFNNGLISSSENSDSDADPQKKSLRVGPAMPSKQQLQMAQEEASRLRHMEELMEGDDEIDSDIGPSFLMSTMVRGEVVSDEPLGGRAPVAVNTDVTKDSSGNGSIEREEWMVDPGKNKSLFDIQATVGIQNRKFKLGKEAKKIPGEKEAEQQAKPLTEEEKLEMLQTQQFLDEYAKQRGPSLMEAHLEGRDKKKDAESSTGRRGFDREKDFLSHRSLSKIQAEQLATDAKQLNDRFSGGTVQKSFM